MFTRRAVEPNMRQISRQRRVPSRRASVAMRLQDRPPCPRFARVWHPELAIVLLLVSLTPFGAAFAQTDEGAVDLRPMWREGQSARYRIEQTEVARAQVQGAGEAQQTTTQIDVVVDLEVIEADPDGGGVVRMTIDELTMDLTGPTGEKMTITKSSGGEGTEPLQEWIGALLGTPLRITVGPNGAIAGVEGYQAIQQKAGDAGANLNEKYFQEIARDLAVLVGGQASVEPGESWETQHEGSHRLGALLYDTTYTLQGVQEMAGVSVALVQRTAEMEFEPDLSGLPENAPEIDIRVTDAGQSAQIMFDLSRHEVVGGHFEQVLGLETSFSIGGRDLTRTMTETTSTQLLRVAEE